MAKSASAKTLSKGIENSTYSAKPSLDSYLGKAPSYSTAISKGLYSKKDYMPLLNSLTNYLKSDNQKPYRVSMMLPRLALAPDEDKGYKFVPRVTDHGYIIVRQKIKD